MQAIESPRPPLSIVMAVAVRLYRDALASALATYPHLSVKGAVGTLIEAQTLVRSLAPDLLIVDVSLEDVCAVMRSVRRDSPACRIVAFAVREDISTILDYAEAGADGFVTANGSVAELVEAIERTAAGELLCSPRIAAQLLRRAAQQPGRLAEAAGAVFTSREQQVFVLLKQGLSNKEIAGALNIAEATVKNHVHHVLEKLQVATRGQAAASPGYPVRAQLRPIPTSRRAG